MEDVDIDQTDGKDAKQSESSEPTSSPMEEEEDEKSSSSSSSSSVVSFHSRKASARAPTDAELQLWKLARTKVPGFPTMTPGIWFSICSRLSQPMRWATCTGGQWRGKKNHSAAELHVDKEYYSVGHWLFYAFVDNEPPGVVLNFAKEYYSKYSFEIWRTCNHRDCIAPSCALEVPVHNKKPFSRETLEPTEVKDLRDWFRRSDIERFEPKKIGKPYKLTTAHARELLRQLACAIVPGTCTTHVWTGARHKTPFIRFSDTKEWWSVVWLLVGRAVTLQETFTREGGLRRACKFARCINPACYHNPLQASLEDRLAQYKLPSYLQPLGPPMELEELFNSVFPIKNGGNTTTTPRKRKRNSEKKKKQQEDDEKMSVTKKYKYDPTICTPESQKTKVPSPFHAEDAEMANWVLARLAEFSVTKPPEGAKLTAQQKKFWFGHGPLFCRIHTKPSSSTYITWMGPTDEKTKTEPCIRANPADPLSPLVPVREQLYRYFVPGGRSLDSTREVIHTVCERTDCLAPTCCFKVPMVALPPLMPAAVSAYVDQLKQWLKPNWQPMHNDAGAMLQFATAVQCNWKFGTCSAALLYHGPQQIVALVKVSSQYMSTAGWLGGAWRDQTHVYGVQKTVERWKLWEKPLLEQQRMPKCKCWTCVNPACFERIRLNLPLFSMTEWM